MKLTEIAPKVLEVLKSTTAVPVAGGFFETSLSSISALSLIPYYCDPGVQWILLVRPPADAKLDAKLLRGIKGVGRDEAKGELRIGVPGDGLQPALHLFQPLATALTALPVGSGLELCAANLGTVRRDNHVKAETALRAGNQRYVGSIMDGGQWRISHSYPAVSAEALRCAVEIGQRVETQGPWEAKTHAEAVRLVEMALGSLAFNVSADYFRKFIRVKGKQILLGSELARKHPGVGMVFFRLRFADGPWDAHSFQQFDEAQCKEFITGQLANPWPPPPQKIVVDDKMIQDHYARIMADVIQR